MTFFERDAACYAGNRDLHARPGGDLVIDPDGMAVEATARRSLRGADVAIVTACRPDATAADRLVLDALTRCAPSITSTRRHHADGPGSHRHDRG